ncbi:MAG: DUF5688 family protein [Lachnospiraceae bacterium]|nr:DUF5688 family protein [Lachnospiraceae bacterium]
MMEYKDFVQKLQDDLSRKMPDMVFMPENMKKIQRGAYDGISATPKGSRIGVVLRPEDFYSEMKTDDDYGQIVSEAEDFIRENTGVVKEQDLDVLFDYEAFRENLTVELVGREQNQEMLAGIPHRDMEDMALIYRVTVSSQEKGGASVVVTNELLNFYGITPEQLHQDALKNAAEKQPFTIVTMESMVNKLMGLPEQDSALPAEQGAGDPPGFYIATTLSGVNGAAVIAYPDFMEEAAKKLQGDFFVLPSSIHEVLLLKDDGVFGYRELEDIVSCVNVEVVLPEEKLTDKVYHYDNTEKVFELAEKFEYRKQEQKQAREEQPRSVLEELKNLKEKTEQRKPKPQSRPTPAYGASL